MVKKNLVAILFLVSVFSLFLTLYFLLSLKDTSFFFFIEFIVSHIRKVVFICLIIVVLRLHAMLYF